MSIEELQVRGWLHQWKNRFEIIDFDNFYIETAKGREGVHDFNFAHYESIAYEIKNTDTDAVIARAEGRDALKRLLIVAENLEKLGGSYGK